MAAITIYSDFEAQKKSLIVSIVSPSICHEVMGPDAMILVCWALSQLFHSPLSLSSTALEKKIMKIIVYRTQYVLLLIYVAERIYIPENLGENYI